MAITFVNSASAFTTGTATSITINAPANIQQGDILIAHIGSEHGSSGPFVRDQTWNTAVSEWEPAGTAGTAIDLWRVATSTEPSSYKFTSSTSADFLEGGICAFRGVDNTTPIDVAGTPSVANTTAPQVSIVTTNAFLLYLSNTDTAVTPTAPTGMTQMWSIAGAGNIEGGCGAYEGPDATGNTGTRTSNGSSNGSAVLIALRPATITNQPPLPARRAKPHQIRKITRTRAVHVRPLWKLPLSPHPDFPEQIRHKPQRHRLFGNKAKRPVKNRWIVDRQVTAPHADFPEQLRRRSQHHRIQPVPHNHPLRFRPLWKLPLSKYDFPEIIRHRGQPHRLFANHAKRPVKNRFIDLRLVRAYYDFPEIIRHHGQAHRLYRTTPTRPLRAFPLWKRLPPPLPPQFPEIIRHHGQAHRLFATHAKRSVRNRFIDLRLTTAYYDFPEIIRHRAQAHRLFALHAKRAVRNRFIDLRLTTAYYDFPEILRRKSQQKRFFRSVRTHLNKNRIELTIPPPPPKIFPPELKRRSQLKRFYRNARTRLNKSRIELTIPPAPLAIFPPGIRSHPIKHRAIIATTGHKRPVHAGAFIRFTIAPPATVATILQDLADLKHISAGLYRRKIIA